MICVVEVCWVRKTVSEEHDMKLHLTSHQHFRNLPTSSILVKANASRSTCAFVRTVGECPWECQQVVWGQTPIHLSFSNSDALPSTKPTYYLHSPMAETVPSSELLRKWSCTSPERLNHLYFFFFKFVNCFIFALATKEILIFKDKKEENDQQKILISHFYTYAHFYIHCNLFLFFKYIFCFDFWVRYIFKTANQATLNFLCKDLGPQDFKQYVHCVSCT